MAFTVLVVGSSGNLGSEVCRYLEMIGCNVIRTNRYGSTNTLPSATLIPWDRIELPTQQIPDAIINLANYYIPNPSESQVSLMKDSIEGIAVAIIRSNEKWRAPIVLVSTYFQYLPQSIFPRTDYVTLKEIATEKITQHSVDFDLISKEVVLYDNFGGRRKSKFFDQLLYNIALGTEMRATPGNSLINLTHVIDISHAFELCINEFINLTVPTQPRVEVYSPLTYSLRELASKVEQILEVEVKVDWGALEYRENEVFDLVHKFPLLEFWVPTRSLSDYVRSEYKRLINTLPDLPH